MRSSGTSWGLAHKVTTGVEIANGSPWRSVIMPRCAVSDSVRSTRASPCPCKKERPITCRVTMRPANNSMPRMITHVIDRSFLQRSEEHTSELQYRGHLVYRLLL